MGTRDERTPKAPQLNLLVFLVCGQHLSWCLPGSTVPAVRLSQVALKTEVTVTQVSIRHRGPRPEWCISAWREEEKELGPWRWWWGLLEAPRAGGGAHPPLALCSSALVPAGPWEGLLYE